MARGEDGAQRFAGQVAQRNVGACVVRQTCGCFPCPVARRRGGDLLLAAASPFFVSVLRAARLDALFTTFDTVPRAISYALNPGLRPPEPR